MNMRMERTITVIDFEINKLQNIINELAMIENEALNVIDNNLGKAMMPILTIRISSYGGDIYVCDSIISYVERLKSLGVHVITECMGFAYSCGALLFIHGDERRFMNKNFSYLLWHSVSCANSPKKIDNVEEGMSHKRHVWKTHKKYLINHTKVTSQFLKEKESSEWYIYYPEALKLGIVTE